MWGDTSLRFWFLLPQWLVILTIFPFTFCPFVSPLEKYLFKFFSYFFPSIVCFSLLSCMSFLYNLGVNPLSDRWVANIFSHSTGCLFIFLMDGFFCCAEAYIVPLIYFCSVACAFGVRFKKKNHCQDQCQGAFSLCVYFSPQ